MRTTTLICCPLITAVFVLTHAQPARAQLNPTYGGRPRPVERDTRYRGWVLDGLKNGKGKKPSEEELRRVYERVRKDFERIQVLNNDVRRAASSGGESDYEFLSAATAEINKCATRLDASLALPPPEEELKTASHEDLPLSVLLSSLDGLIVRFIKNPTFKEAAVIDREAAPRAKRNLLLIIRLSKHLTKRVKQMGKTGGSR